MNEANKRIESDSGILRPSDNGAYAYPRWLTIQLVVAICGFLLVGFSLIPIPMLYFYDEGCYFIDAKLFLAGERPYTDFFVAHPPGVIWINAAVVKIYDSIYFCRILSWLMAVAYAILLYHFIIRLQDKSPFARPAAYLGVLFLTTTHLFLESASQVLTNLPGMLLTLAGFYLLLPGQIRPVLAGLLLAAASLFRIQVAFIGPAWVTFILATFGWTSGRFPIVRLTLSAAFFAAAFHGTMAFTHTSYLDCVIHSHVTRPKTPPIEKLEIMTRLFREPQVALGLFAATMISVSGRGPVRGIGVFVVCETILTLLGSRFLMGAYFLMLFPYLFACGAILIVQFAESVRDWRPILAAAAVVTLISGIPIASKTYFRWTTQRRAESELIGRLRATPGTTVACTPGKIPLFAGKELVRDYLCPDTTSPVVSDFGSWFVSLALRADIIVITDTVTSNLTPSECRKILELRKPILFGTPGEERDFHRSVTLNNP